MPFSTAIPIHELAPPTDPKHSATKDFLGTPACIRGAEAPYRRMEGAPR